MHLCQLLAIICRLNNTPISDALPNAMARTAPRQVLVTSLFPTGCQPPGAQTRFVREQYVGEERRTGLD